MGKRKRSQKERKPCPSECVACDGQATGFHYEPPSCTSCKTFFRRTVLMERVYTTCLNDGVCNRNDSVNSCRACRFDRCVKGGMNPLFIVSIKNPEANLVVQRILQHYSWDRSEHSNFSESADSNPREMVIIPKRVSNVPVLECTIDRIIGGLLYLENAHQQLRASQIGPLIVYGYRLDTVIMSPSLLNTTLQIDARNVFNALQEGHTPPYNPISSSHSNVLPMPMLPKAKKFWPFADLLFSIEYLKTFEFFHYLSHEDKKALIRHVSVMCSHLTLAFFSYENKSEVTLHPDGTRPHNGCVPTERAHEWQLHHGIIQIVRHLELDKKEYVLLKALIVCNPAIEDLSCSHKDILEFERLKYSKSLMSYVLYRRGDEKGPAAFTTMIAIIDTLTHLMKKHKDWHILNQALKYTPETVQEPSLFNDVYGY